MSKIALTPNANGSGVFTLASPNSNTNRTITLPDESVTLGAGTPSIDDNGNATAITIDSSENVMVGTANSNPTSSAVNVAGQSFSTTGGVRSTVSSNAAATFNRKTDDGGVVLFRKDGTTVGSIQSRGGTVSTLILDPRTNGGGLTGTANAVMPTSNAGVIGDANTSLDLGASGYAFRNAYLSGGVYLGGTGSANKLSDVETGTWTPALNRTGSNYSYNGYQYGTYEKIGNLVVASFTLNLQSISTQGSSYNQLSGLPFTPSAYNANLQFVGSLGIRTVLSSASSFYWAGAIFFLDSNSNPIQTNFTTGFMSGFITYKTAS